jgi:hypothetical protein
MAKQISRAMIFLNNEPTNFYMEKETDKGESKDYLVNMVGERLGLLKDFGLKLEDGKWKAVAKRIIFE